MARFGGSGPCAYDPPPEKREKNFLHGKVEIVLENKQTMSPGFKKKMWLFCILGLLYMVFMSGMGTDQLNLLYGFVGSAQGWSNTKMALPTSVSSILCIPTTWLVGTLLMKRRVSNFVLAGFCILAICPLIMVSTSSYVLYFIAFVVIKLGCDSLIALSFNGLVAKWFMSRRGYVLGVVTMGNPMSAVVFIPIINYLVPALGIIPAYVAIAVVIIIVGVLFRVLIKETPAEAGEEVDGLHRTEEELAVMRAAEENRGTMTAKDVFSRKENWFIMIGLGFVGFSMIGGLMNMVPTLMAMGFPLNRAVWMMSAGSAISILMSHLWGWLDDRIGAPKTLAIMCAGYAVCCLGLALGSMMPGTLWLGYLGGVGMGCLTGGVPNLGPSCMAFVNGRNEYMSVARYLAAIGSAFSGIGPTVMAYLNDVSGSFAIGYFIAIALSVIALILFLMIKKSYDPERAALAGVVKG